MLLCVQVGVAYVKLAVSEGTDFSIARSVDPEAADLLRAKGSRTVTKFTLITLTTKSEDTKTVTSNVQPGAHEPPKGGGTHGLLVQQKKIHK